MSFEHPASRTILRLPAALYGMAVNLRNRAYDRRGAAWHPGVPVISVGNITVGGTGKTPIVAWLCRHLLDFGLTPAIVSRGYRGRVGRGPLVVSSGDGPTCEPDDCGDEPFLLARNLPGVRVVVGSDRRAGAAIAVAEGADVLVLDDGFQHRRLARDMDLVLLDASNPFGNYRLFPAGGLREPVRSLARADAVLVTRTTGGEGFSVIERVVRNYHPTVPIFGAGHRGLGFVDGQGKSQPAPARASAFCGVGNPGRFRADLEHLGIELVAFRAFRDHHRFARHELEALRTSAQEHDVPLVTTEKDLVRIDDATRKRLEVPLLAYRIEAVVHRPDPLLDQIRALVRKRAPA